MFSFSIRFQEETGLTTIFRTVLNIYAKPDKKEEVLWARIRKQEKKHISNIDASLVIVLCG